MENDHSGHFVADRGGVEGGVRGGSGGGGGSVAALRWVEYGTRWGQWGQRVLVTKGNRAAALGDVAFEVTCA